MARVPRLAVRAIPVAISVPVASIRVREILANGLRGLLMVGSGMAAISVPAALALTIRVRETLVPGRRVLPLVDPVTPVAINVPATLDRGTRVRVTLLHGLRVLRMVVGSAMVGISVLAALGLMTRVQGTRVRGTLAQKAPVHALADQELLLPLSTAPSGPVLGAPAFAARARAAVAGLAKARLERA